MAQLVAYALRRWPLFRAIVSTKQHTCHARALPARVVASNSRKYPHAVTWSNTNALLNTKVYGKAPGARARRPPRGARRRRRRPTSRSSSSSSVGTAAAGAGPDGSAGAAAGDSGDDTAGGGGGGDSSSVLRAPSSSGHSGGSVEATFVFHGVKTVSSALRRRRCCGCLTRECLSCTIVWRLQGITRAAGGCLASWLRPVCVGPSESEHRQATASHGGQPQPFTWQHGPRSCSVKGGTGSGDGTWEHHDSCGLVSGRRSGASTAARSTPRSSTDAVACTCSATARTGADAGLVIVVLGSHNAKARFSDTFKLAQWAVGGGQLLRCDVSDGAEHDSDR